MSGCYYQTSPSAACNVRSKPHPISLLLMLIIPLSLSIVFTNDLFPSGMNHGFPQGPHFHSILKGKGLVIVDQFEVFTDPLVFHAKRSDANPPMSNHPSDSECMIDSPDFKPELVWMKYPEYPEKAKKLGIEGKVSLSVFVDKNGKVKEVKIIDEQPGKFGFGANSIKSALKAVFKPAVHNNRLAKCWVTVPIEFKLDKVK